MNKSNNSFSSLPPLSDHLTPVIQPSETTTWDGLSQESLREIAHQRLSCLEIHLATPRRKNESWEEGLQTIIPSDPRVTIRWNKSCPTRRTHNQNTGRCLEPKRFSKFYSIWEPILLFSGKCNLWGIHSCFCWLWRDVHRGKFVLTIFKSLPTIIPLVMSSASSTSKWLLSVTAPMWHNLHVVDSLLSWGKVLSAQRASLATTKIERLKNVVLYNC